jgi:hypothetical protein
MASDEDDIRAIRAVIARQFKSLCWQPGTSGDWEAFAADFLPGALLYPAARPAKSQTAQGFIERMKGLACTTLLTFDEAPLGIDVRVFGNVAVAIAGCEMTENNTTVNRGVEMMLLIKNEDQWMIVSQAWDLANQDRPLPAYLRQPLSQH